MTELSFLVELLLNHRLQKSTKDLIAARIKEVEECYGQLGIRQATKVSVAPAIHKELLGQAPSTIAAMLRHANVNLKENEDGTIGVEDPTKTFSAVMPPSPVAVVAQTAATMAAMNSRQQAIGESMAGKVDKQTGRPRKW